MGLFFDSPGSNLYLPCFTLVDAPKPVSYTHLDVYKRQVVWLLQTLEAVKHALKAHFLTRAAARGRRVTHKERAGSRITSHVADRGQGYTRSDRFVRTKSITRPAQPKRTPKKRNARPTPRPRPAPLFLSFSRCRWLRLQLTRASGVRKQKNRNHHRKSPNPLSWHHYHGVKWCNGTREKQRWCGIWHRWCCLLYTSRCV